MARNIPSGEVEFPQFTEEHGSGSVNIGPYSSVLILVNFTNHYKAGIGDASPVSGRRYGDHYFWAGFVGWYGSAATGITGMYILVGNSAAVTLTVDYNWSWLGEKI